MFVIICSELAPKEGEEEGKAKRHNSKKKPFIENPMIGYSLPQFMNKHKFKNFVNMGNRESLYIYFIGKNSKSVWEKKLKIL